MDIPNDLKEKLGDDKKKIFEIMRKSAVPDIEIVKPEEFYKQYSQPTESKLHRYVSDVKEGRESAGEVVQGSSILEFNLKNAKWRWKEINSKIQLKDCIEQAEKLTNPFRALREAQYKKMLKKRKREDFFGGFGSPNDATSWTSQTSFPVRNEYSPLIGTPFFKQLYLYDYWLMHSKAFWYKNYSGIAKAFLDITRSFVLGEGYSVTIEDDKAKEIWERYEERMNLKQTLPIWLDELCFAGEIMLKRVPTKNGIMHKSIDCSTIWDIITDPENISDVKYYHQQYNTQYQIFGDKKTPLSKYIIQQIPPELVIHKKINVTTWEKRGRSDFLSILLYLKYFEDFMQSSLIRKKNEAAFIWDVTIKGDDTDVSNYITNTQSIVDVPPGSENVHNEAIERKPLSPVFSKVSDTGTADLIVAYAAMGFGVPKEYTGFSQGGQSRASALVKTEPVAKKMEERRSLLESIMNELFEDAMIDADYDPKTDREFNFPELVVEDRSQKIADVYTARDNETLSKESVDMIVAKELGVTNYDYDREQAMIKKEKADGQFMLNPDLDLTSQQPGNDDSGNRSFNRQDAKKSGQGPL